MWENITFNVEEEKPNLAFIDLEKAFDWVARKVMRWALRKLGVEERRVSTVTAVYCGANAAVRTGQGDSNSFEVKVGVH